MSIKKSMAEGFARGELYDVLKWQDGTPYGATFDLGTSTTSPRTITIQLTDYAGENLTNSAMVIAYLSNDAAGLGIDTPANLTSVADGGAGALVELKANTAYLLLSDVNGQIQMTFTKSTGVPSFYLSIVLANGAKVTSGQIQVTAA